MSKTTVNVAILGLNRQTASIGMALREHSKQPKSSLNFVVGGADPDSEVLRVAKQIGAVDETSGRIYTVVKNANIVISALPQHRLADAYADFGPELKAGAVVLEMSFTKQHAIELARQHFPKTETGQPRAYVVGIHPLVHSDYLYDGKQDTASATPQLFAQSEMILAPDTACPPEAIKLASDLAEILQMRPRFLAPEEYDGLVDFTENLPMLMSIALFGTLQHAHGRDDLERMINPHFALMLQIFKQVKAEDAAAYLYHNQANTLRHLDEMIEFLSEFRRLVAKNDSSMLTELVTEIVGAFHVWDSRRQAGEWEKSGLSSNIKTGIFASLFGFGGKPS